jgi:drug/metabolite transporter (DMT)-like permease
MSAQGNADRLSPVLWWILAGLTLAWGFNWTAMKVALSEVAPFTFRSMCLGAGSAVLFAVMRASGQPLAVPRGQRLRLVLLALVSVTGWNVLVAFGLTMIPSGRAAILAYTMPAWAIPLSVWLLGERMTGRKLLGFALGMAGIALLLAERVVDMQVAPVGSLLVLCAALTWALSTVLIKRFPVSMPAGPYTAWIMLLGGVPIFVGALFIDDFGALAGVSPLAWAGVAYNVLVAFAFAHWAWIKLATSLSVTAFSLSMLLTPLVGVFSGMLFLGEKPTLVEYSALALVLGSLLSVMLPGKRL